MGLKAGIEKTQVHSNEQRYQPQSHEVHSSRASYDACYYEITMDESIGESWEPTKLNLKILNKSGSMNAYVYGGKSRFDANESLTLGNA